MGFEIRDACADDHVRLHAIHHRATMSSYGRALGWLDAILADPATPLEATANHLENLYVDPAAQGRGVGSALLAGVEARLRDRFATATLRCLHANPEARRLYERQGYRVRQDQTVVLHGRPLVAWLMEKPLRGA